jgi:hypothetical protein
VETQTTVGIAVMCLSLSTGAAGAGLLKFANGLAAPHEPARRSLIGTVPGILAQRCGNGNPPLTCYRPVVDYTDTASGESHQLVSRTGYRPSSPHRQGERVTVYIDPTGAAWLAPEWDAHQAARQRDYENKRSFPLTMGCLLIGCGAFGMLLGTGIAFWVDRRGSA